MINDLSLYNITKSLCKFILLFYFIRLQLRLLYEGNPMAFIIEKAGGLASTGRIPILDVQPQSIHERVPVFLGSRDDVQDLIDCYKRH